MKSPVKKINLLYVTTSVRSKGGIEETLRLLCRDLDKNLFEVGLCSLQDSPDAILSEFQHPDIRLFGLNRKAALYDISTAVKLKQIINTFDADIVHTHNDKGNWHGRIAALLAGRCKIITTHHDLGDRIFAQGSPSWFKRIKTVNQDNLNLSLVYPFFNVFMNRFNDKIICVSQAVKAIYTLQEHSRYTVVYAPYDEQLFKPIDKPRRGPVILGTVGRLVWQKGHLILLQALIEVLDQTTDVRLKIKGAGDLENTLKAFVAENGLDVIVEFCGELPHTADLYHDLDIYIQASVSEGCSITLLEAMACRLPVIATDQGGPKELIVADQHGLLVEAQNHKALADAIMLLINHPESAQEMADAARQKVMHRFSGQAFIEQMTHIYQQA